MGWLEDLAERNVQRMSVTADVSQALISTLKYTKSTAPGARKRQLMFVIAGTPHDETTFGACSKWAFGVVAFPTAL